MTSPRDTSATGIVAVGIDIGSVSVNTAIVDLSGHIVEHQYLRHLGRPLATAREALAAILDRIPASQIELIAVTGSGGRFVADLLQATFVNEVVAQARSTAELYPQVRTVIEIGGEDSKLIFLQVEEGRPRATIADFAMNTICAAGTGSFLDQQAHRLGLTIEEFARLALKSEHPPRLAGRCSVFAKSDMIHLQQKATPSEDIVAGLCFAMARNFKSTVGAARTLIPPISFQGGVAANPGIIRAFEEVLELESGTLIVPEYFAAMGAIGAVLAARDQGAKGWAGSLEALDRRLGEDASRQHTTGLAPLSWVPSEAKYGADAGTDDRAAGERIPAYLGVDVGSISTNVVVMDEHKRVLAKRYLMTAGAPIVAVRQGLAEVGAEVGDQVEIRGACTTGSGRYLIGDFIGADLVKNEITAQARAAVEIDPSVDTIFEIGGQDSKYISLDRGAIIDFEMNKVCAAGTGSFLEEQAEKLGISIKQEFGRLALAATAPANLGERCTVFMESELVRHQQSGVPTEDLVAGLSYSIVYNYLNRVVGGKRVGERIFFQGGVAANVGVAGAFASVTGKQITVPEHHEVTGAIGCALLARENDAGTGSRFKGFDLSRRQYEVTSFECHDCPNRCEVNRVTVEGERPRFYGSRCEKYDVERKKGKGEALPDLFLERENLLLHSYEAPTPPAGAPRIGIPRAALFHDLFPLWQAFFGELGCEVVLSDPTTKRVIHRGVEQSVVETCFPMKVALGHVLDLADRDVDYLFLPSVINLPRDDARISDSFVCPYIQSLTYAVRSVVDLKQRGVKTLEPAVYLQLGRPHLIEVMSKVGRRLHKKKSEVTRAVDAGLAALARFQQAMRSRGAEVLADLPPDVPIAVLVSRAYNGCDSGANLEIPRKLRDMGVLTMPMDFMALDAVDLSNAWGNMYWRYGQKILAAAEIIAEHPRLTAIYLTNFGCGPDSFLTQFFRERMGEKPYLQIEVDEHSADAGIITRCEAFLDSLESARGREAKPGRQVQTISIQRGSRRTILVPYMADQAYAIAAAFQANDMPAEVLPEPDEETLFWGRKYTSGKECYPCIVTTGDMVKAALRPDFDRDHYAFFMGGSGGPCRFGQYHTLQRMALDEIGFPDVPIYAPNQAGNFFGALGIVGRKFLRQAWQGMVAIDVLHKALREIKPYETEAGATEQVYGRWVKGVCQVIREDGDLPAAMAAARSDFERVPMDRSEPRPVIGVVGEFYVRWSAFSNNRIVDTIESLGGEVWVAPVYEWFLYRNFRRGMRARLARDYRLWAKNWVEDQMMKHDEHSLGAPFHGLLRSIEEPSTREILEMSAPYVHQSFEGEAIMTVGKAIDFAHKGLAGVVSVMPFTCMPGTIAHALMKRVKEEHGDFPFLNMVYDGSEQSNTITRVEAFMHQAREHDRRRRGADPAASKA
jgi:predicted CoA-substrate-specific enzyme activase